MFKNRLTKLLVCVLVAATASGCAVFDTVKEKRKIDYQTSRRLPPLEIPPDLTNLPAGKDSPIPGARSTATYSEFISDKKNTPGQAAAVIPDAASDMRLEREGRNRWLVVKAEPDALWPKVRQFVLSNGLLIARENAQTGVIETDWAENRAKVGTAMQLVLAKWMSSLYSTGTRDRFRIRLEHGREPGSTDVYLSHQGMEEVVASGSSSGSGHVSTMWQGRPSDPDLETEMLRLLMAHLGAKDPDVATDVAAAPQPERAKLARTGDRMQLSVQDDLDRAWRRVGLSLDRIGFTVEDRDRSKGIYYVRYIDPDIKDKKPGFFARLFGAKEKIPQEQYQIQLKAADSSTDVAVLDKEGAPDKSKIGERILSLLHEQLK